MNELNEFKLNAILACDGYKIGHKEQYPKGVSKIVANFTARNGKYFSETIKPLIYDNKIAIFGIKSAISELKSIFNETFFYKKKSEVCNEYFEVVKSYLGKEIDISHIEKLHDYGNLPLTFRSLPEGSIVDIGVPFLTVENTKPEFFWVTNKIETLLSTLVWISINSATTAFYFKRLLLYWANKTGADTNFCDLQGHDFSFRGFSSLSSACKSGASHLCFFKGTDTIPAIQYIKKFYITYSDSIIGCSVNATEHSVMCCGGQEKELDTYKRLLTEVYPTGIVSIVSDTWDLWEVVSDTLPKLKTIIENRGKKENIFSKLVIRPDSGCPIKILTGDADAENQYAKKGLILSLMDVFGYTTNEAGFKRLPDCIGAIYGDSINPQIANTILNILYKNKICSDSVVFGMGSYLYYYNTRDTLGQALKSTFCVMNGKDTPIFKDPATDVDNLKKSIKGLPFVYKEGNTYKTETLSTYSEFTERKDNLLQTENIGEFIAFEGIRERFNNYILDNPLRENDFNNKS